MSDTAFENIQYEAHGSIATITVAREKALNALNGATLTELVAAVARAEADRSVRVVIVTGAGEKAFVAGADIAEMANLDPLDAARLSGLGHALGAAIEQSAKPYLAAVNGFALGGGCELALACDLIFASDRAKFGQPEVNLAVIPGFGGTQRLPRRIGTARAAELILTGDLIDAQEALRIGLVNRVFAPNALIEETRKVAHKIASKGGAAIAAALRAVRASQQGTLEQGLEQERQLFADLFATDDQKEGMAAFLEKRPPKFRSS